jgi:hypothetical protein
MADGTSLEIKVSGTRIQSSPKWHRKVRFSLWQGGLLRLKTRKKRYEVEPHVG